jgi:hypothetical protein
MCLCILDGIALQEDPDPRNYSTYLATCLSSDHHQQALCV